MLLGSATQEAIWLKRLLYDLHTDSKDPMEIREDNQGTIAMIKKPIGHKRTKHIDVKHDFVRESVQFDLICVSYCTSKEFAS
jgi:KUP system potassium uptake protein